MHIPNLSEFQIRNIKEAMELYKKGESHRKVAETQLNDKSSRSHTVFKIHLEIKYISNTSKVLNSMINLIDLAGSESVSRAKTQVIILIIL